MPEAVCRMMTLLCALVGPLPIGTNLGLLHRLWLLTSGRILASRGAVFSGLSERGLSARATRRAWAALGQGKRCPPSPSASSRGSAASAHSA